MSRRASPMANAGWNASVTGTEPLTGLFHNCSTNRANF